MLTSKNARNCYQTNKLYIFMSNDVEGGHLQIWTAELFNAIANLEVNSHPDIHTSD
ncbi:hypothetical protein Cha6605_2875 [Chamaesiphon minutus PCC 6605]|uniref:Uncharacterized protein n=1 Tax=Chamaesiphon minutus (strain ATCC 27169 / PCC 6605) TaxID=1173020 RepID=K9UHJ2_CHAP6|nr:hypothetical protein Cha6605_2875 [Chamaesiphon minutus PCC 6605]